MSFWPLFVLLIVAFVAMVVVLRQIMARHLTRATTHLQDLSAEYTRRQEELKERLATAEQQYQEQVARAKAEADRILAAARQEAESAKAAQLEEARLESERVVRQAMDTREALRKELERQLEARAVERACEFIEGALSEDVRQQLQTVWLEELFRNGLSQFDRLKQEADAQEARIVSALPLSKEQRQRLHARLKERLGHEVALTEQVDARLVAGLTITIGSLVFDGSLASKVRLAARKAKESA
jgi:ATP synthase F1 delta subunit